MKKGENQWAGFRLAGLLCPVLAVVTPWLALPWSWWRVLLPLGVALWHNVLCLAAGLVRLTWMGCGREGDELKVRRRHTVDRYRFGSMVCAVIFVDNVLRPGRNDVLVLSAGSMLACQFLFWSGIVTERKTRRVDQCGARRR